MNIITTDMVCGNGDRLGGSKGSSMMEDPQTPGSDCNSNPAMDSSPQDLINSEFIQDNVEYQWFIDYGYREGGLHVHPSILSSLSASYSRDDLGYYDDLSRNLDANLAEIDMESFRTADIHTLLTALPVMCTDPIQHSEFNYEREQYASISGSVMEKLDIGSSISPHTSSQGEDSACSTTDTISICKSSLLFSPLKETPVLPPGGSYSVDSLDCEDMLLTCQTNNKNNYTIAFEGSMTMFSDSSQDFENQEKRKLCDTPEIYYDRQIDLKNIIDLSMACSDSKIYTTWSNLKHSSMNKVITRHPSGNNNTIPNFLQEAGSMMFNMNKKSQSLPDLTRNLQEITMPLNFSMDSAESNHHVQHLQNSESAMSHSANEESSNSVENHFRGKKLQNLSLVRLFMKQKSTSAEGMSLTLDQSDSESGWPTSHSNSDSGTNTNTNTQTLKQNINSTCHQNLDNELSIQWKRADCYKNQANDKQTETIQNNIPKPSLIKEFKDECSSTSTGELFESVSKSESLHGQDKKPLKRRTKSAWSEKIYPISKTTGVQAITQMEDNEMQTSMIYVHADPNKPSVQRTIINRKPVFVIYPNYTLPDLSFLNIKDSKLDHVSLKPQSLNKNKPYWPGIPKTNRPFSCNDIDALKQKGFPHVRDWESLVFLLPTEYKKILHEVPEISKHININEETKKPLFCLSPPMRNKTRLMSDILTNNTSSTSSTATQPSSGYRGSSTILTDSLTNPQALSSNVANPLYLYRYDSISSDTSLTGNDKKTSPRPLGSGKIGGPIFSRRSLSIPHEDKEANISNRKVPPRPPLPRSILRKSRVPSNKRYSMFEMGGVKEIPNQSVGANKRMSLQEPYYINNDLPVLCHGRISDSEKDVDETEEKYHTAERLREMTNNTDLESEISEYSEEDIKQLDEFLKRSGLSSQSSDDDEDSDAKLRSYIKKFLCLKINKNITKTMELLDSQKKTVSFSVKQRKEHLANKTANNHLNTTTNEQSTDEFDFETSTDNKIIDLEEKTRMMTSIKKAAECLLAFWNAESTHIHPNYVAQTECAQLCISNLCPALYVIMSDGLKPHLSSTFGPIANSVWQVVEASSQQGPLTKTLNELVQKINGEDVITEGMLKFNAFVFGLLNLRALDAWFTYLCTRESILRKHYNRQSLFIAALSNTNAREIVDSFLYVLNPLAFYPFQLDLLHQYRQLHNSFGTINNHTINAVHFRQNEITSEEHYFDKSNVCTAVSSPKKIRPRSCVNYSNLDEKLNKTEIENVARKRLSNPLSMRVFHTVERGTLEVSEDYTDSLEHSPLNKASSKHSSAGKISNLDTKSDDIDVICGEAKYKKLQEKWELMTRREDTKDQIATAIPCSPTKVPINLGKSKIPRLLTSPIKQPNDSMSTKNIKSPVSGIPALKKPTMSLPYKSMPKKSSIEPRTKDVSKRTSRVDQDNTGVGRSHIARPSSLPYKSHGLASKEKSLAVSHRRAASTSLSRPTTPNVSKNTSKQSLKEARTLTHRSASGNGHLSFGEGEKLKIIFEVDNKWLLCARGDKKGLVPRSCVHILQT